MNLIIKKDCCSDKKTFLVWTSPDEQSIIESLFKKIKEHNNSRVVFSDNKRKIIIDFKDKKFEVFDGNN